MICIKPKKKINPNVERIVPEIPTLIRRYGKTQTIGYLSTKGISKAEAEQAIQLSESGEYRTKRLFI